MKLVDYYTWLCIAVVVIGILLILYIRQRGKSRLLEQKNNKRAMLYQKEEEEFTAYARFFPRQLLALLGIRQAKDVSTQLSKTFQASVVSVNVLDYTKAIHTMGAEELFCTINGIFTQFVPLLMESGAIIESFEKSGLTAMYLDNREAALTAVVSMCEAVDQQEESSTYSSFSVGIDHGEVMLGIVGTEKRMSAVAMSEGISISNFLQEKALKYGARILATENFTLRVPDFRKKYNSRLLGYFYHSTQERMVEVYDIYDGDPPERKQGKRRTRMIFEQGVDRFVHGEYDAARLHFVEVLKADRYDLAAREYLYLCDGYCTGRNKEIQIYIEKF